MQDVQQLIDYLCQKFGTTAEYLLPEFAKYKIGVLATEVTIALIFLVIGIWFLFKMIAEIKKGKNQNTDASFDYSLVGFGLCAATSACLCGKLPELVGYLCSPVAGALKDIAGLLN